MKQMTKILTVVMLLGLSGYLRATSPIAQFAQRHEAMIQAQIEPIKIPLRRQQTELSARRAYANRLKKEQTILLKSGRLTTPEVARLREERAKLIEQLEALDKQISEASMQSPEIMELQAIAEANNNRIEELRKSIMPDIAQDAQPDAEP